MKIKKVNNSVVMQFLLCQSITPTMDTQKGCNLYNDTPKAFDHLSKTNPRVIIY